MIAAAAVLAIHITPLAPPRPMRAASALMTAAVTQNTTEKIVHSTAIPVEVIETQSAAEAEQQDLMRCKIALEKIVDEFLCPITSELPLEPVFAEDGRVYEASAISDWFAHNPRDKANSPVTSELIGKQLFPAVQVQNTIRYLITTGVISGDKAAAWKKIIETEKLVAALRTKAEDGDVVSMRELGVMYRHGLNGLPEDCVQAFAWLKPAADKGDPVSQVAISQAYLNGDGVARNEALALINLVRAAEAGSQFACYLLGNAHEKGGTLNVYSNPDEAAMWYRRMVNNATIRDGAEHQMSQAQRFLRNYEASSARGL